MFNLLYSLTKRSKEKPEFYFFTEEECQTVYSPLFPQQDTIQTISYLSTDHPDILVIIMEGFGAGFIENLGGMQGIAPCLNQLTNEGICFSQCYCSSIRTDRGLPAILSGCIALPNTSIMKLTRKMHTLPGLPAMLRRYGYDTQCVYGGDITFFNMSDYFLAAGHDRLISQENFSSDDRLSNWGVPDHIVGEWIAKDLFARQQKQCSPSYTTWLTLSSHTPFDVPFHRLPDIRYNAFAYTDSCIGALVDTLRASPIWDNLLIACIADHGFNQSMKYSQNSTQYAHIPFLLFGGAVKDTVRIDKIVSQTDFPATILGQMGLPHDEFLFSRDVLSNNYTYPWAFNTFNNGFMFRDSTGCIVWDNVANAAMFGASSDREQKGKAVLQTVCHDFERR